MATAFQIMEDWAHGLTLDPEEIDQERGVVIKEWRLGQGAAARLRDQQFPVIFSDSHYAERLPIGTRGEPARVSTTNAASAFLPRLVSARPHGGHRGRRFRQRQDVEALTRQHFERSADPAQTPASAAVYPVPDHDETLFSIVTDPEISSTTRVRLPQNGRRGRLDDRRVPAADCREPLQRYAQRSLCGARQAARPAVPESIVGPGSAHPFEGCLCADGRCARGR